MLWWSEERKLERRLTHVQRVARKLIRQTEAKKSREEGELQGVLQECSEAEAMAMDELNSVSSQNLLHGARRLGIAAPEFNKEAYQEGYTAGFHYLTAAARMELRRLIREENKARREEWTGTLKDIVIPVLLALTGLTGAAIGLVSALRSK
jgi:hypothetical protein